jgi:hypothetical protein
MEFEKKPMVDWYDPKQLAATGIKTVVSTVFGNFADRREMQAALDTGLKDIDDVPPQDISLLKAIKPDGKEEFFDYSQREDIWIDYISDLGDGFNPTFTLAKLLAEKTLDLNGTTTERGKILVMGGDEVYPTPEIEEYRNRLQGPYHAAFPEDKNDKNKPHLFAIPGNHDWYDGLTNFLKVFCQKRSIGNWQTQQRRSYFALKLPHNYWFIGIDIQLESDIDYPQIQYFQKIAKTHFKEGDKVLLATAEPAWVYESFDVKNNSNKRLNFFINRILKGYSDNLEENENYYNGKNKNLEINLIITGDLHHYSRYEDVHKTGEKRQLITAGGGGAFMHTTHSLKERAFSDNKHTVEFKKAFPSKEESFSLNNLNFRFLLYGWKLALVLSALHIVSFYLLVTGGIKTGKINLETLPDDITVKKVLEISVLTPSILILTLVLGFGIYSFTDVKSGQNKLVNKFTGFIHGLLHAGGFYVLLPFLFSVSNLEGPIFSVWNFLLMGIFLLITKYIYGGFIFGFYLWFSSRFLGNHITEASSSFKGEDFKNFIRIHISEKRITIYPIGIRKVVKNWKNVGDEKNPRFEGDQIKYELIEEPIQIPH